MLHRFLAKPFDGLDLSWGLGAFKLLRQQRACVEHREELGADLILHGPEHALEPMQNAFEVYNEFSIFLSRAEQALVVCGMMVAAQPEQILGVVVVAFRDRIEMGCFTRLSMPLAYRAGAIRLRPDLCPDA